MKDQQQESKSEERIKGLGPKKQRKKRRTKEAKKVRSKAKRRQDQRPVTLQPFFKAAES